jgi:serine/threonine-protein kinase
MSQRLSGSTQLLIDGVCSRFEAAWQAGNAEPIEHWLGDISPEFRSGLLLELIAMEIELRVSAGERPLVGDYLVRFPEHTEIVRQAFSESQTLVAEFASDATLADTAESNAFPPTVVFRSQSGAAQPPREVPVEVANMHLPGYRIDGILGRGGMGMVLRAWDEKLHRSLAIKTLLPHLASDETFRQRFMTEARASAAIRHPNVVTIHAVEELNVPPFLVLELVEGHTLGERLSSTTTMPIDEVLRIASDLAAGLAAAHAKGIVHRDLKPANVLIEASDGRARLTDFGLARVAAVSGVTASGTIAGTPQYMSPEQVEGKHVDGRSDLFSLGAVLYRMVSGQPPFSGESVIELARKICDHTPTPASELKPEVPAWLGEIIQRLLAKKPENRFQSANELAEALARRGIGASQLTRSASEGDVRSRLRLGALAAAVVLLVALGVYFGFRQPISDPTSSSAPRPLAPTDAADSSATPELKSDPSSEASVMSPSKLTPTQLLTSSDYEWSPLEDLGPPVNTPGYEAGPCLAADGLSLLLHADPPKNQSENKMRLWQAWRHSLDEPFGQPLLLDEVINNQPDGLSDPTLTADGRTLAFCMKREDGVGAFDLWICERPSADASWSAPTNAGPNVNSHRSE